MSQDCDLNVNPRSLPEYRQGRSAFAAGTNECPYPSRTAYGNGWSQARNSWWTGWLDARTESKHGKL